MLQFTTLDPPNPPATWTCPFCKQDDTSTAEFDGVETYSVGADKRTYTITCSLCEKGVGVDEATLLEDLHYTKHPHQLRFQG